MATLRLPSGEMRLVRAECRATVGAIGNADHQNVKIGKAGRKRHMGVRPQTRGTAMNPVDHPHGGGEGSTTAVVTRSRPGASRRSATARARRTRHLTATSSAVAAVGRASASDEPLKQEGPVGRGAPDGAHRGAERRQHEDHGQDLVAPRRSSRRWSGTRSPSTTAASTSPSSSASRWSATSSASSRPRVPTAVTLTPEER